jgi:hypothetical protein
MAGLQRRGVRRSGLLGAAIALAAALAASPASAEPAERTAAAPAALAGPGPPGAARLLAQCAALDAHILGLIEDHAELGGSDAAAPPEAIHAAVAALLEARALLRERRAQQALSRYESIALGRPRRQLR